MITWTALVPKWFKTLEVKWISLSVYSGAFIYCVTARSHVLTDAEDGLLVSFVPLYYPSQGIGKNVE